MDLLCAQFNSGSLSLEEIKTVLGNDFAAWQGSLSKKFVQDEHGKFYNERLVYELNKRKSYTKSRRDNLMGAHKENVNVNEIENRKLKFIESVKIFTKEFSEKTISAFCDYWTEHSEGARKMRYEKETVFEISKRLATWKRNEENFAAKNPSIPTNSSPFPNYYDYKLEQKLGMGSDLSMLNKYYQHLRALGFKKHGEQWIKINAQ